MAASNELGSLGLRKTKSYRQNLPLQGDSTMSTSNIEDENCCSLNPQCDDDQYASFTSEDTNSNEPPDVLFPSTTTSAVQTGNEQAENSLNRERISTRTLELLELLASRGNTSENFSQTLLLIDTCISYVEDIMKQKI